MIGTPLPSIKVRLTGLEPARRETLDPKSSASTNSATGALFTRFVVLYKSRKAERLVSKAGAKVQKR